VPDTDCRAAWRPGDDPIRSTGEAVDPYGVAEKLLRARAQVPDPLLTGEFDDFTDRRIEGKTPRGFLCKPGVGLEPTTPS
jgi:hypothetical protein